MNATEVEYLMARWIDVYADMPKGSEDAKHVAYLIVDLCKTWATL